MFCRHLRGGDAQSVPPAKMYFCIVLLFFVVSSRGVRRHLRGGFAPPVPPAVAFCCVFFLFLLFLVGGSPPFAGGSWLLLFFFLWFSWFPVVFLWEVRATFAGGSSSSLRFAVGSRGVRGGFAPPFAVDTQVSKSFAPPKKKTRTTLEKTFAPVTIPQTFCSRRFASV